MKKLLRLMAIMLAFLNIGLNTVMADNTEKLEVDQYKQEELVPASDALMGVLDGNSHSASPAIKAKKEAVWMSKGKYIALGGVAGVLALYAVYAKFVLNQSVWDPRGVFEDTAFLAWLNKHWSKLKRANYMQKARAWWDGRSNKKEKASNDTLESLTKSFGDGAEAMCDGARHILDKTDRLVSKTSRNVLSAVNDFAWTHGKPVVSLPPAPIPVQEGWEKWGRNGVLKAGSKIADFSHYVAKCFGATHAADWVLDKGLPGLRKKVGLDK